MNSTLLNPDLESLSRKLKLGEFANLWVRCSRDLMPTSQAVEDQNSHLQAAIEWLERAQDQTGIGGVSDGYSLRPGKLGWGPAYRETTGYICETFFDLAHLFDNQSYRNRAQAMSEWLLDVQNIDGSISNPRYGEDGIIFDTGQVLFGYLRALQETGDPRYQEAAIRAGTWLVQAMDQDGAWRKYTHLNHPHTYNSRVAWALVKLGKVLDESDFSGAGVKNLEWSKTQITNDLFENCAFRPNVSPFTHTIAYAIRGFLESSLLLNNNEYARVAEKATRAVFKHMHSNGFIPGQISTDDKAEFNYCCLTGNCQMSIICFKLGTITGDSEFINWAKKSLRYVAQTQDVTSNNRNIRGAIKGSHPFWGTLLGSGPVGGYTPLIYPNWATKFFVDALLEQRKVET